MLDGRAPGRPTLDVSDPVQTTAQAGTVADFQAIYAAELGYVWNTLRRCGVPDRHLEDLAHDVFVVVYRRLDDYDRSRPLRPWLFGIAFRVASDFRRKASHGREVPSDLPPPADPSDDPEDQASAQDRQRLLLRALDALDDDKRAVLVMHELDGHAMPEIAEALSVPLNTAYSRLRLARKELAAAVRRLSAREAAPSTMRGGA